MGSRPGSPERKLYSSKAWRDVRRMVLERDGMICQICFEPALGRAGTPTAAECDHIVPLRISPELALEPGNLRTSCKRCNNKRKGRMDIGKVYSRRAW